MATNIVSEPGVLARVDVDRPTPKPADCLPAGEEPIATASLSPGWIAVTDRELLTFHPENEPPVDRTDRANVTGLAVRRTGGRTFFGYVPGAVLYAVGATVFGALLLTVSPEELVTIPDAPGASGVESTVRTLGWATGLLGTVLVFTGILAALIAATVVAFWLLSGDVVIEVELGDADPIECPTTRNTGTRALRELERTLSE